MSSKKASALEWEPKPGAHLSKKTATLIELTYKKIIKRKGNCTPDDFLEASRSESSPTHHMFEWDDTRAAERWRREQARHYLKAVVIKIEGISEPIRPIISIVQDNTHTFIELDATARDPNLREQILQNALDELNAFKRKYARLKKYCKLIDNIVNQMNLDLLKERNKEHKEKKKQRVAM